MSNLSSRKKYSVTIKDSYSFEIYVSGDQNTMITAEIIGGSTHLFFHISRDVLGPHIKSGDKGALQSELTRYFSNIENRKYQQPEVMQGTSSIERRALREAFAHYLGLSSSAQAK